MIRAFVANWRSEEAGHTAALDHFLRRYARSGGFVVPERQLPPAAVAPWRERVIARVGGPVGAVVAAAHMAWGAANELLTLNGYRILAERCEHPVLIELTSRIAAQEARHYSFYMLQAQWRLAASASVRATLRRVLDRSWTPVGVGDGYKSPAEFGEVLQFLGASPDAQQRIRRMDQRFAALPGFEHLRIYERAASTFSRTPIAA